MSIHPQTPHERPALKVNCAAYQLRDGSFHLMHAIVNLARRIPSHDFIGVQRKRTSEQQARCEPG